jgi:diguanylate cyclase (GGDEF)-like protein
MAIRNEQPLQGGSPAASPKLEKNKRGDLISGLIALTAIVMFASLGGEVVGNILAGTSAPRDPILAVALLLNIALIIIGWRHHNEVTEQIANHYAAAKRARALASKDPLTGLFNRRAFTTESSIILERSRRRNKVVAMFVIDLDSFKYVNDLSGHHVGDVVLSEVSQRITAVLPGSSISARLGGDEFAAAFQFDTVNPAAVDAIADELVERLSQPFAAEDQSVQISASVGVARSDADCNSVETLIRRADIAMYAAKRQGKNRAVWFDGSMERMLEARNRIEAAMRTGIPKGEFVPFYEQQIDLSSGRLHGFEVLARWNRPGKGIVPPDEFIHAAEESGLIGDLSESVMRQAFIEAGSWDSGISLSVNISPSQLKDPWLAQKIIKLLTETNFPANRLEIEITETALFENLGVAQSIINSLKNQGIRIALDDFGTGYSSLAHLRALPFDRIKIDRSFVTSINDDGESAAIVDAITRLGTSLGLPITAEGIENESIQDSLKLLGSMEGQGWHFGKPMPIGKTRRLLASLDLLTQHSDEASPRETPDVPGKLRRAS